MAPQQSACFILNYVSFSSVSSTCFHDMCLYGMMKQTTSTVGAPTG